jgi:hypothetical protein
MPVVAEASWVPHIPGFPVKFVGVDQLHAAFRNESRTRGRCLVPRTGNPGISLVSREIWDPTNLSLQLSGVDSPLEGGQLRLVVSHISRKTSEMWATHRFVAGEILNQVFC